MEKEKINKYSKFLITVLVIFLMTLAGFSVWYYMDQQAQKDKKAAEETIQNLQKQVNELKSKNNNTTTLSETENWNTYETSQYSIKYPSDWTYKKYGQIYFYNKNIKLDSYGFPSGLTFFIWEPPQDGHGGPGACLSDDVKTSTRTVTVDGKKIDIGTCTSDKTGKATFLQMDMNEGQQKSDPNKIEIWFQSPSERDLSDSFVDKVLSTFNIK